MKFTFRTVTYGDSKSLVRCEPKVLPVTPFLRSRSDRQIAKGREVTERNLGSSLFLFREVTEP
jgi:hypothetical protein